MNKSHTSSSLPIQPLILRRDNHCTHGTTHWVVGFAGLRLKIGATYGLPCVVGLCCCDGESRTKTHYCEGSPVPAQGGRVMGRVFRTALPLPGRLSPLP